VGAEPRFKLAGLPYSKPAHYQLRNAISFLQDVLQENEIFAFFYYFRRENILAKFHDNHKTIFDNRYVSDIFIRTTKLTNAIIRNCYIKAKLLLVEKSKRR
jgi:hypothetical protein